MGEIIQSGEVAWRAGIQHELQFWDEYIRTQGGKWSEEYKRRMDPDAPLQPRPAALLPPERNAKILDVGAGPLTYLGKIHDGKKIDLMAVDPLALEYDKIIEKYKISPPVRTLEAAAEDLTKKFESNSFDLVFARNCIDHSYSPEHAVLQMIEIVAKGCYVLMEHRQNEAEHEQYLGLHQWNFSMMPNGDFIIGSKTEKVNMSEKYKDTATMKCEVVSVAPGNDWMVTRIFKK
ncbi:MAG TPA: class I SAM-dependent methyltransferase [Verrucomicrobiae bacterium]|nr:class I SAM-dependent methyltransferase [Verrucomicrobiae bacterium]